MHKRKKEKRRRRKRENKFQSDERLPSGKPERQISRRGGG